MFGDVWYARARRENIKLQRTQIKIELHQKIQIQWKIGIHALA